MECSKTADAVRSSWRARRGRAATRAVPDGRQRARNGDQPYFPAGGRAISQAWVGAGVVRQKGGCGTEASPRRRVGAGFSPRRRPGSIETTDSDTTADSMRILLRIMFASLRSHFQALFL